MGVPAAIEAARRMKTRVEAIDRVKQLEKASVNTE